MLVSSSTRSVLTSLVTTFLACSGDAFVVPRSSAAGQTTAATRLFSTEEEQVTPAVPEPRISGPRDSIHPQFTQAVWSKVGGSLQAIQGDSLRTFRVPATNADTVQVLLRTPGGRPAHSTIELWYGPDYQPTKISAYLEDGKNYPLNCFLDTPYQNTVGIYNDSPPEFPIEGGAMPCSVNMKDYKAFFYSQSQPQTIQGGSVKAYNFAPNCKSVQVFLQTEGRHLDCRIELLQGPNNVKQQLEVYTSDGKKRSFYAVFETPYEGCQLRIINEKTIEYPIIACIEPLVVEESTYSESSFSQYL